MKKPHGCSTAELFRTSLIRSRVQGLLALGVDPKLASRQRSSSSLDQEDGLLQSVMVGIAGILSEPVRSALSRPHSVQCPATSNQLGADTGMLS